MSYITKNTKFKNRGFIMSYQTLKGVNDNSTFTNSYHGGVMDGLDIRKKTQSYYTHSEVNPHASNYYNPNEISYGLDYNKALKNSYRGIEYDWEVPNTNVVESPGGVASNFHHWTKGFYGNGGSSRDKYGFQDPRYLYGEYGNLYDVGETSTQRLGYYPDNSDPRYYNNQEPPKYTQPTDYSQFYNKNGATIPQKSGKNNFVENYTDDFEMIINEEQTGGGGTESFTAVTSLPSFGRPCNVHMQVNTSMIFLIFILMFLVLAAWSYTGFTFFRQKVNRGSKVSYQQMFLFSLLLTLVFVILLWYSGPPITVFQSD